MKSLNKKATEIFNRLVSGMNKISDHKKIANNPSFMAVCIEVIDETKAGAIISIAHYGELNGDLMRDPESTFLRTKNGIFPLSFRQDNLGIDQEVAIIKEDGNIIFQPKQQRDVAVFCSQWMVNIKEQQGIRKDSKAWKCSECGSVIEVDQEWLADHGEPVCEDCDCDMKLA
jgi:hypothetical protein